MSAEARNAALIELPPEDRATAVNSMNPTDRAAALATMAPADRSSTLTAMSAADKEAQAMRKKMNVRLDQDVQDAARATLEVSSKVATEARMALEAAKSAVPPDTGPTTMANSKDSRVRFEEELIAERAAEKAEIALAAEQAALLQEAKASAAAKSATRKWEKLRVKPGVKAKVEAEQEKAIAAARRAAAEAKEAAIAKLEATTEVLGTRYSEVEEATAVLAAAQKAADEKLAAEMGMNEALEESERAKQVLSSANRALEAMPHHAEEREHGVVAAALQTVLVEKVDTWAKLKAAHFPHQVRKAELDEARAAVDALAEGDAKEKACAALFTEEVAATRAFNESAQAVEEAEEEKAVAAGSIEEEHLDFVLDNDPLAPLERLQASVCGALNIGIASSSGVEIDNGSDALEGLDEDARSELHKKVTGLAAMSAEERAGALAGMDRKERLTMLAAYTANEGIEVEGARPVALSQDNGPEGKGEDELGRKGALSDPEPGAGAELYMASAEIYAQMALGEDNGDESTPADIKSSEEAQDKAAAAEQAAEVTATAGKGEDGSEEDAGEQAKEAAVEEDAVAQAKEAAVDPGRGEKDAAADEDAKQAAEETPEVKTLKFKVKKLKSSNRKPAAVEPKLAAALVQKEDEVKRLEEAHAENEDRKEQLDQTKDMIGKLLPDRPIEESAVAMEDDIQAAEKALAASAEDLEQAKDAKQAIEDKLEDIVENGLPCEDTLGELQNAAMSTVQAEAERKVGLADKIKAANDELAALQAELLGAKRGSDGRKELQQKSDDMEATIAAMRAELDGAGEATLP